MDENQSYFETKKYRLLSPKCSKMPMALAPSTTVRSRRRSALSWMTLGRPNCELD